MHQVNVRRVNRGLRPVDLPPECLQRLASAVAAAIAGANATQPLLGPALFLRANCLLVTGNEPSACFPAGLAPPG